MCEEKQRKESQGRQRHGLQATELDPLLGYEINYLVVTSTEEEGNWN